MSILEEIEPVSEEDRVVAWRREQLLALGFSDTQSELLAYSHEAELAQVRSLVRAGCAHATILRIVL
jgi:hypothetical protein